MKYEPSKYWERTMEAFLKDLEKQVRDLISDAIDDYIESDAFTEDAKMYCQGQGWKEPA